MKSDNLKNTPEKSSILKSISKRTLGQPELSLSQDSSKKQKTFHQNLMQITVSLDNENLVV